MRTYKYQKKGIQRKNCNDAILIEQSTTRYFTGVADGAGDRKTSLHGAEISLKSLKEYMHNQDLSSFLDGYRDQRQFEILSMIRNNLQNIAWQEKNTIDDYASSVCAVYGDTQTGDFISVNLGDGIIIGGTKDGNSRILSGAENQFTQFHTYLTTEDGVASHIRLGKGKLESFKFLMIMTDGVWKGLKRTGILSDFIHVIFEEDMTKVNSMLDKISFKDDASLILLYL